MKDFKKAFYISLSFVAALWTVELAELIFRIPFSNFGIYPGRSEGLMGILSAPFVHGGFMHIFSNTMPLIVLGTGMLYLYPVSSRTVIPAVYLLGGFGVWLFARPANHIGASGLVYGFAGFIFFSGIVRRDARAIALSLIVVFLYGGMIWGVFPRDENVSFESHLSSAVVGILCSFLLRKKDQPPAADLDDDESEMDEYWNVDESESENV